MIAAINISAQIDRRQQTAIISKLKNEGSRAMHGLQKLQETPALVQMPVRAAHRDNVRRRTISKGMSVFGASKQLAGTYVVANGEVMILRDGRLVDIVEAGELLDARIWRGATAIAYTDCTLAPRPIAA